MNNGVRDVYLWKFDKDTYELTCEVCQTSNYDETEYKDCYLYYKSPSQIGNKKVIKYKDLDKYQYGRVVSFSNDKTYIWNIVAKALLKDSMDKQEKAQKAMDLYMNFKTFNPDPRRSN